MPDKEPLGDDSVSHTMCPECFDYFKKQWDGMPLEKYLDDFQNPIVIMDSNCRIIAANEMAEKLTGKSRREVVGLLGGEAMECAHALLPEGCGKTVHCETCTFRRAINEVVKSGKSKSRIPVKFTQMDRDVNIRISVVLIGELIRIMIED